MKIKAYKKDFDYTYTLGVFETIELLKNRPDLVLRVYIKSNSYKNKGIPIIDEICREKHIYNKSIRACIYVTNGG